MRRGDVITALPLTGLLLDIYELGEAEGDMPCNKVPRLLAGIRTPPPDHPIADISLIAMLTILPKHAYKSRIITMSQNCTRRLETNSVYRHVDVSSHIDESRQVESADGQIRWNVITQFESETFRCLWRTVCNDMLLYDFPAASY